MNFLQGLIRMHEEVACKASLEGRTLCMILRPRAAARLHFNGISLYPQQARSMDLKNELLVLLQTGQRHQDLLLKRTLVFQAA